MQPNADEDIVSSFGFLDGISNPTVIGFDVDPPPGPAPVRAGVIIVGHDGDPNKAERVPWMTDGSFMAFRLLYQRVPEFDEFVWANRLKLPGLSDQQGADLFGARLMGRWKSGAPLDLAPFFDDPALGKNENM
jgi:deferrochelatase/peroxidase EfeB